MAESLKDRMKGGKKDESDEDSSETEEEEENLSDRVQGRIPARAKPSAESEVREAEPEDSSDETGDTLASRMGRERGRKKRPAGKADERVSPRTPAAEPPAEDVDPETTTAVPGLEATADADKDAGSLAPTDQTRALLRRMKHQDKMRLRQDMAEAEEMERRAKELARKAKDRRRVRQEAAKHAERVRDMAPQLGLDPSRPITVIPEITEEDHKQVEFTTVLEGRSYIRIIYDASTNRYLYDAIEPTLTDLEKEMLDFIKDTLVRTLDGRRSGAHAEWEEYLHDAVERAIVDHSILIDEVSKQRILYYIVRDFLGYGPVDVMMRDPMIEDISCDGPGIPIYIFHRQYESIRSNVVFEQETDLDAFVIRLAQRSGKHISIAEPLLDATLPDTSRLQATLGREVTTRGSSFTIRKFRADPLTPPDLVRLGTISPEIAAYYWLVMEEGESVLFCGGTASGKTTTLNAVSQFIPPDKKIVSIEDTREINLTHDNWIAGLTRSGFGTERGAGKPSGEINMYDLLSAALRQRPEYLLVGEVRGPEALTLFQAMATGHATYSTLHADSVMSAVYRLENAPINIPRIMLQTLEVVGIQVQVRRDDRMVRRMREVTEITGIDPDNSDLLTNTVFRWDPATDTHRFLGNSHAFEEIRERKNMTRDEIHKEWEDRTMIIEWMADKGIRHIADVSKVVSEYYRRPESLMGKVRGALKKKETEPDPEQEIERAA